jgi:hypothetical protein
MQIHHFHRQFLDSRKRAIVYQKPNTASLDSNHYVYIGVPRGRVAVVPIVYVGGVAADFGLSHLAYRLLQSRSHQTSSILYPAAAADPEGRCWTYLEPSFSRQCINCCNSAALATNPA